MKKLIMLAIALLGAVIAQAKDPMTLESGSLAALADPANTVLFKVDYSKATVHNDGNNYTVQAYLKHRGDDFVRDWKESSERALSYIPVRFNDKNKKGAQALMTEGDYSILGTVILTDIDFGNGAGTFVPFGGAKGGGCIISGKLVFTDKNGAELAVLPFANIKGMGSPSETTRLGMSYFELTNKLCDVMKKENKKKK